MSIGRTLALVIPAALLVGCGDQPVPTAAETDQPRLAVVDGPACSVRANNTVEKLLECVTLGGVQSHMAAFQAIADANGGTRAAGTPGYDQSANYVATALRNAGYQVTVQPFQFQAFINLLPPLLEQVTPAPAGALPGTTMGYSGSGNVTAPVANVAQGGCNASDFAGFPAGSIALISRGACTFNLKATNAYNAGATAVVVYNNQAGSINGTLGANFTLDLPVMEISQALGQQLAATPALVLHVRTSTFRGLATTHNVLAETPSGDPNNVVMVGAHLDGVNAGPGIQDNGSGSAAILETALQMARVTPRNKVRFAWWGAEEVGLVGSYHYVNSLSWDDLNRIALYLNFDMIASPNFVFGVYDGDNSAGLPGIGHPPGSEVLEGLFASYFSGRGLPTIEANIIGGSDHQAFVFAGIPVGGLFAGAGDIKNAQQASLWGGTAGDAFDPCYHLACDTYANVNPFALDVNADGVAFATLNLAMNTTQLNGGKGKGNFKANGSGPGSSWHAQPHQ